MIFCYQKSHVLYVSTGTFGACVVNFYVCLQKINFHFSVNCKITHLIDQKNLQLTVDQRHYWPKVPNILRPYLSIQNLHFLLLWDFFARNLLEKVHHHVQGSKISRISGHQGSQYVTQSSLKVYFHLVNAMFAVWIQMGGIKVWDCLIIHRWWPFESFIITCLVILYFN